MHSPAKPGTWGADDVGVEREPAQGEQHDDGAVQHRQEEGAAAPHADLASPRLEETTPTDPKEVGARPPVVPQLKDAVDARTDHARTRKATSAGLATTQATHTCGAGTMGCTHGHDTRHAPPQRPRKGETQNRAPKVSGPPPESADSAEHKLRPQRTQRAQRTQRTKR